MAESSLCFPICSKFITFLQNLCKVFGLWYNRTEILDSASAGVYVLFLPLFVILPAANEAKNKQFVTS